MARTVLVTGATAGFGAAVARLFVNNGWRAVVTGRRADRIAALVDELGPDKAHGALFDIRDAAAMGAALDALPPEFA